MSETQVMTASEFKAKCLEVFDRLADRSLERLVVTKRGRPVAILTPPERDAFKLEELHGCMRGSVNLPPELEVTEPLIDPEDIAAMKGILHY